jgi:hypothetical protein
VLQASGQQPANRYERSTSSGFLSKISTDKVPKPQQLSKEQEKEFRKFCRKTWLMGCPRIYGLGICQTKLRKFMPSLKLFHRRVWNWLSTKWGVTNDMDRDMAAGGSAEGTFLVKFKVVPPDNAMGDELLWYK